MNKVKKNVSAGIIITDGEQFLIGHVTNSKYWSIPKGLIENDEQPDIAACRETEEETGIIISPETLTDLGEFKYTEYKNLHLFLYKTDTVFLPPIGQMVCSSVVVGTNYGFPEIDQYKYIRFEEITKYLNKSMIALFESLDISNLIAEK